MRNVEIVVFGIVIGLMSLGFQNCSNFKAASVGSATMSSTIPQSSHSAKDVCQIATQNFGSSSQPVSESTCQVIASTYQTHLRRSPGIDEVQYWNRRMRSGATSVASMVSTISSSPEARAVTQALTQRALLWGPWIGGIPSERNVELENLNQFNQWVGKPASLVGFNSWWHQSVSWGGFNSSLRGWMNEAVSNGATPVVLWLPMDPNTGLKCGDANFMEYYRKFSARSIASGIHDNYIRQWARDAKAFGKPFYLRPFHELNSRNHLQDPCEAFATPWTADLVINGERLNSPENLIAAWRHVVELFRAEGATNVKWMWSVLSWPSENFGGNNSVSMKSIYPGDAYVDMIGIECYNFVATSTESCVEIMKGAYSEAAALSPTLPILNVEMGMVASPHKAKWVADALDLNHPNSMFQHYPRLTGFMYWQDSRVQGLWLRSDPLTMAGFKAAIAHLGYVAGSGGGTPDGSVACRQDGTSLPHAAVAFFFRTPSAIHCIAEQYIRGCNQGVLGGDPSYEFSSCSSAPLDSASARKIVVREMKSILERSDLEMSRDASGVSYWMSRLQSGLTVDGLINQLKGSDEYFLRRAYEMHLGRKADSAGLTYYLGEIRAGRKSRTQVVSELQLICAQRSNGECGGSPGTSPTAVLQMVESTMMLTLERTAAEMAQDSTGVAYWVSRVHNGLSQAGLVIELRASDEYFVRQAYVTHLRRKADPGGVAYYVGELRSGKKTRAQVVADLQFICAQRIGGECP